MGNSLAIKRRGERDTTAFLDRYTAVFLRRLLSALAAEVVRQDPVDSYKHRPLLRLYGHPNRKMTTACGRSGGRSLAK